MGKKMNDVAPHHGSFMHKAGYREYIIQKGNGITPWMKTKPRVWLNVTPGGRGTSLLFSYPALTNEMQVKFMKVLPGKRGGWEHWEVFTRVYWRESCPSWNDQNTGMDTFTFLLCLLSGCVWMYCLLNLCIYLSYCQYLKCMKNIQPGGLNTNPFTYKWS